MDTVTAVPALPADQIALPTARESFTVAFGVWLTMRLLLSAWGALRFWSTPPAVYADIQAHVPDVILPQRDLGGYLVGIWNLYDTPHYTNIAANGYAADP